MDNKNSKQAEQIQETEMNKKKIVSSKTKIILAIIGIVVVIALLASAVELIEYFNNKKNAEPFEVDFNFYPADYNENIFDDEEYLELIQGEYIRLCDSSTNVTVGIDTERAVEYSQEVQFMLKYINDIISGDHESYNTRFSEKYYENNTPLERFTMQKVYDVLITQGTSESIIDEKTGTNYTKHNFVLEYKIYENNGTFRRDIGRGSKKQYITLTDRYGELLIDDIRTEIIKQK